MAASPCREPLQAAVQHRRGACSAGRARQRAPWLWGGGDAGKGLEPVPRCAAQRGDGSRHRQAERWSAARAAGRDSCCTQRPPAPPPVAARRSRSLGAAAALHGYAASSWMQQQPIEAVQQRPAASQPHTAMQRGPARPALDLHACFRRTADLCPRRRLPALPCALQPSQKRFAIKKKLAKKAKQNRPIPPWIRFRVSGQPWGQPRV